MAIKTLQDMRRDARAIYQAGLAAVEPAAVIDTHCRRIDNRLHVGARVYDLEQFEAIRIIGAGKASAAMAGALERHLGNRLTDGLVIVKYDHGEPLRTVRVIEAGHPDVEDQIHLVRGYLLARQEAGEPAFEAPEHRALGLR